MAFVVSGPSVFPEFRCGICLSGDQDLDLSENGDVLNLQTRTIVAHDGHHPIHLSCLHRWIEDAVRQPRKPDCPECRREIISIGGVNVLDLPASPELVRGRYKAMCKAAVRGLALIGRPPFAVAEKMLKNSIGETIYFVRGPEEAEGEGKDFIVKCQLSDSRTGVGPYAWKLLVEPMDKPRRG